MIVMYIIQHLTTSKKKAVEQTVFSVKAERKSRFLKNSSQSTQLLNSAVGEVKQDPACSKHGLLIQDWICPRLISLVDLQTIGEGLFCLMGHHRL